MLLLAAFVRIQGAASRPAWTDEGWTTWAISDPQIGSILSKVSSDTHPPLFFLSLSAWSQVAGDSRIALRLFSIFAGLLTVALAYRIGADVFEPRAGLLGALITALLPLAAYYGQEIRDYSLLVLVCTLGTWLFLRFMQKPTWTRAGFYAVSVALMLYTLYLSAVLLAVHGIVGLFVWKTHRSHKIRLIAAWIGGLILFGPWLAVMIGQSSFLLGTVANLSGYPTTLAGLLGAATLLSGGQLALIGGSYLLGAAQVTVRRAKPGELTVLLCGVGALALLALLNLKIGALLPRYMVYLTPFIAVVSGFGLAKLPERARWLFAGMFIIALLNASDGFVSIQPRLNSDDAARALAAQYSPGDVVILENGWDDNALRYEVLQAIPREIRANAVVIRTLPWVDNRQKDVPVMPQVMPDLQAARRVWVVNWLQPSQVIPALDAGNVLGYQRAYAQDIPVEASYAARFRAPMMHLVMFERISTQGARWRFGDTFRLADSLVVSTARRGDTLHVDLWWEALKAPPFDYSVGVFLQTQAGGVVVQHDGPPAGQQTTKWALNTPIFDRHSLNIPTNIPSGLYTVGVQAYWYGDKKPLTTTSDRMGPDAVIRTFAAIGVIDIQ